MLIHGVMMTIGVPWTCGGRRRVVDQFDHPVAQHHPPRRHGQIGADLEGVRLDHADVLRLGIPQDVLETVDQTLAAGLDELAHGDRVGQQKIGRRHGIEPFAHPERGAPAFLVGQPGRLEEHVLDPVRDREIGLLDDVPCRHLAPRRIGETRVVRLRLDDILARHAHRAPHQVPLQGQHISGNGADRPRQFLRMHQPRRLGVEHRGGHAEGIEALLKRPDHGLDRAGAGQIRAG